MTKFNLTDETVKVGDLKLDKLQVARSNVSDPRDRSLLFFFPAK